MEVAVLPALFYSVKLMNTECHSPQPDHGSAAVVARVERPMIPISCNLNLLVIADRDVAQHEVN